MTGASSTDAGVWRVGIHGARNAGKTCFLACLYGFRAAVNGAVVDFTDDATIDYLKDMWDEYLAKGEKPRPTGKGMPTELRCHVKAGKRVWEVSLRDYAGELVQRNVADEVRQLCDETRDWLKSCNAILVFLDITDEGIRERLNELNLLLAELHRLSADGNTISRPLGLVLTKWDSRSDFNVASATPEMEQEKSQGFLKQHPVLGQIFADVFESGNRVQLFPISAFGSHREGNLPPLSGPQPFNLHGPLIWSVVQSEEMVAERAERDADRHANQFWSQYSRAIALLKKAKQDHGLSKGVACEKLTRRIRDLSAKLWWRRIKLASITFAIAFIAAATVSYVDERTQYVTLVRAYNDPSVSPDGVKDQTERYLERRNPFKGMLGNEGDIRFRWSELQEQASLVAYRNLDEFRRNHASESEAKERSRQDERFLNTWGGSPQSAQVQQWETEDRVATQKYEARIQHESRYQSLLESVAALAKSNKYNEAIEAYHRFLSEHPESPYHADIESRITDLDKSRDEFEWKKVVEFDQKNPNSFDDTVKQARQYLTIKNAKHRPDAESLITRTETRWDRALYEGVCNASRAGIDANSIESTQRKATAYLTGTHPRKQMAAAVQRWLNWFNTLQEERDYNVVVRSMQIPKGSQLEPTFSNPQCRIEVTVNGRSQWTDWCIGMSPVYAATLGPYRFKWGQKGSCAIHIEGYHPTYWNDHVHKGPDEDDRFIIGRLNGPVIVKDRNGLDVTVNLECESATAPSLPPFPNN